MKKLLKIDNDGPAFYFFLDHRQEGGMFTIFSRAAHFVLML
jgi:hypothetical protein